MAAQGKRVLIVSDAWQPQINGVVRSLEATITELEKAGYTVKLIAPGQEGRLTFPLPFYPEIRLEPFGGARIAATVKNFKPDYIHIATEGLLGHAARRYCRAEALAFTTAYHTCFPEYVAARVNKIAILRGWGGWLEEALIYRLVRNFHNAASAVMVATPVIENLLRQHKVAPDRLALWSRGVAMDVFTPEVEKHPALAALLHPIAITVGRVAVEKNIRAFLDAPFTGSKVVVGDGPQLAELRAAYPAVIFTGAVTARDELASYYRAADLFVFPSKTDTFGLVLLEAMACGLPVAACLGAGQNGIFAKARDQSFYRLNDNLALALQELTTTHIAPETPRSFVLEHYSWARSTQEFITAMQATTPPIQSKFLHRLLFDYLLGIPLQFLQRIPALSLLQWGGRKLLQLGHRLTERRATKPPDDWT